MENFRISHSLLSAYNSWLASENDYDTFYGLIETPPITPERFELERKLSFYASLFKMELVDEMQSDNAALELGKQVENRLLAYNPDAFDFVSNKGLKCHVELGDDFAGCCNRLKKQKFYTQVEVTGRIADVPFIGYIDMLFADYMYDIKTTSNFNPDNYLTNPQLGLYDRFFGGLNELWYKVFVFNKKEPKKADYDRIYTLTDIVTIEAQPLTTAQFEQIEMRVQEITRLLPKFQYDFNKYKQFFKERSKQ